MVENYFSKIVLLLLLIFTESPTGSLPMLVNTETGETLVQSMSIARYLAIEFGKLNSCKFSSCRVPNIYSAYLQDWLAMIDMRWLWLTQSPMR